MLQAKMPATLRCRNAGLGPALPCLAQPAATGDPHAGLASPWPVSGRARSQPAPEPDPAKSVTAAPPPASPPPPHRRPPPGRLGPSTQPLGTPQTTCNSIRPGRDGGLPHRRDPQGHPLG
jgi:hypothetical protein